MTSIEIVLLQKPSSPHREGLEGALIQQCLAKLWRWEGTILPQASLGPEGMVVWDIEDFGEDEVQAHSLVLRTGRAGVLLACTAVDELARQALIGCQALGLLVLPAAPWAVAAALEVARATHRRLYALDQERESLARQLAERDLIERAKRVLMAATGAGEAEAMRQMQKHARDHNHKLVAVAQRLLDVYGVFNGHDEGKDGEA